MYNNTDIKRIYLLFGLISVSECKAGYLGKNCGKTCKYPYYGNGCQNTCQCTQDECDFSRGCKRE